MNPCPKPVKWRSDKYKDFIRDQPCMKCNAPGRNTFQHENFGIRGLGKGTATKISDIYGVSLCSTCHAERERYGADKAHLFWGEKFDDLWKIVLKYLNDFLAGEK